jgi:hypothetical protein
MSENLRKYWMLVASKNHVERGIKDGIAQACHGKAYPLKKMNPGDIIIYYSPKLIFRESAPCQMFTAIGIVTGSKINSHDMGGGFIPFRRDINYYETIPTPIKPLIGKLAFIINKKQWGYKFRFGAFEISCRDYSIIAKLMLPHEFGNVDSSINVKL